MAHSVHQGILVSRATSHPTLTRQVLHSPTTSSTGGAAVVAESGVGADATDPAGLLPFSPTMAKTRPSDEDWTAVWPALKMLGWQHEQPMTGSKVKVNYYVPRGVVRGSATAKVRHDYFDSKAQVLRFLRQREVEGQPLLPVGSIPALLPVGSIPVKAKTRQSSPKAAVAASDSTQWRISPRRVVAAADKSSGSAAPPPAADSTQRKTSPRRVVVAAASSSLIPCMMRV